MRDDAADLELSIRRLAAAVSYPRTPDLAAGVRARISARAAPTTARPGTWSLAGAALAAVVVATAALVGIVSPAREAMADLFDRISIFEAEDVPEDLPTDIRGEEVTIEEAERRMQRRIHLPDASDGSTMSPQKVLYQELGTGEARGVASFFEPDHGAPFVLMQFDADLAKGLGFGAQATPVDDLGDGEAWWLEGLRIVQIYDESGRLIREAQRQTDTNTLVWTEEGLVFRLEGDLSQEEAIQIAQSVH
jgi:hypothetical protein